MVDGLAVRVDVSAAAHFRDWTRVGVVLHPQLSGRIRPSRVGTIAPRWPRPSPSTLASCRSTICSWCRLRAMLSDCSRSTRTPPSSASRPSARQATAAQARAPRYAREGRAEVGPLYGVCREGAEDGAHVGPRSAPSLLAVRPHPHASRAGRRARAGRNLRAVVRLGRSRWNWMSSSTSANGVRPRRWLRSRRVLRSICRRTAPRRWRRGAST